MVTREEVATQQRLLPQAHILGFPLSCVCSVSPQVHEALEELPQLDDGVRARMAAALQAAINHDAYFAFLEAPPPDFSLPLGATS